MINSPYHMFISSGCWYNGVNILLPKYQLAFDIAATAFLSIVAGHSKDQIVFHCSFQDDNRKRHFIDPIVGKLQCIQMTFTVISQTLGTIV